MPLVPVRRRRRSSLAALACSHACRALAARSCRAFRRRRNAEILAAPIEDERRWIAQVLSAPRSSVAASGSAAAELLVACVECPTLSVGRALEGRPHLPRLPSPRVEQLRRQRAKAEPDGQTNSEQRQDICGHLRQKGGGCARAAISHAPRVGSECPASVGFG